MEGAVPPVSGPDTTQRTGGGAPSRQRNVYIGSELVESVEAAHRHSDEHHGAGPSGREPLRVSPAIAEKQRQVNDAIRFSFAHRQSAVMQDVEHRRVVGKHIRLEPQDAVVAGDVSQFPKQPTCDPAALVVLFHRECDLCPRAAARVATQTDNGFLIAASDRRNQHDVVHPIAFGEPPELLVAQFPLRKEEALIDRSGIQRPECIRNALPVIRADGANRYTPRVPTTPREEAADAGPHQCLLDGTSQQHP